MKEEPAFPFELRFQGPCLDPINGKDVPEGHTEVHLSVGMSLRDWFAGMAITSIARSVVFPSQSDVDEMARRGYMIADAMIAARENQK